MNKTTAKRSISSFTDLPELYAEMTATDAFEASFGDPLPLTIIEPGEDAGEHYMPDPSRHRRMWRHHRIHVRPVDRHPA
jgi:hypothetical protein